MHSAKQAQEHHILVGFHLLDFYSGAQSIPPLYFLIHWEKFNFQFQKKNYRFYFYRTLLLLYLRVNSCMLSGTLSVPVCHTLSLSHDWSCHSVCHSPLSVTVSHVSTDVVTLRQPMSPAPAGSGSNDQNLETLFSTLCKNRWQINCKSESVISHM